MQPHAQGQEPAPQFFHPLRPDAAPACLQGFTLILPGLSIGQVGQLAVDLVVHNMEPACKRIGSIGHRSLAPIVGADPFRDEREDTEGQLLCSTCDVHACLPKKVVVIQQRAPFIKGRVPAFVTALLDWVEASGITTIIQLASCSSHVCKNDAQITASPFRFIASNELTRTRFQTAYNWRQFEITRGNSAAAEDANKDADDSLYIPGSGCLQSVHDECVKRDGRVEFVAFVPFSNPGTSVNEAHVLVSNLNAAYQLFTEGQQNLRYPASWRYLKQCRGQTPVY